MSTKKIFNVGDKVFAKIRGYPAWPAMISRVEVNTPSRQIYKVYFYGTGEQAECKSEELFPYEDNKSKLGKLNKHKYFEEALLQIEEDVVSFDLPENDTQERAQEFIKPSYTSTIEQESQSSCKLTVDKSNVSKEKELSTYKKCLKISAIKPQDLSKKSVINKVQVPENLIPKDIQCIKLGETLKSSTLEKASGQKYDIADKNISTDVQTSEIFLEHSKTLNTTIESVAESNEFVLETFKTGKSISNKNRVTSNREMASNSSNLVHVPCSGYESKQKKYSCKHNKSKVPKSSRLIKKNSKSSEKQYNSMNESDTSLDQHFEIMNSNSSSKTRKTSNYHANHAEASVPSLNDATIKELEILNSKIDKDDKLPIALKNLLIIATSDLKTKWEITNSNNDTKIKLLNIELDLLNLIEHLRIALGSDYADYDKAIYLLEKISKLQLNAVILKKNVYVVGVIKLITKYVGNKYFKINGHETNENIQKVTQIQSLAETIYSKFISFFTVLEGQTFHEVFQKEVRDFHAKTKHLSLNQFIEIISDTIDD